MQLYYIQYPSMYSSCTSQRPIVASNNLVKRDFCSKESEKNVKQDSKYLQSRWCRSGLSHTQKKEVTMNAQARISGATSGGSISKVRND